MSEEEKKTRPRRRQRRRPRSSPASAPQGEAGKTRRPSQNGDGSNARRGRQGSKDRPRGRGRSKPVGRRPRRDRSARNWWTRRWSEILDVIQLDGRLRNGRAYARQGRVVDLTFEKGSTTAMVQGSRNAPYLVRMHFAVLSAEDWKKVLGAIGEDTELGGGLFLGEFPQRAEEVFTSQNLSLFPSGQGDLKAACSCPDEANPCKHIAAVYYALGEEIDRDPFLLLRLRGLDRTELMEALARTPAARAALVPPPPSTDAESRPRGEALPKPESRDEPLPQDPQLFWAGPGGERTEDDRKEVRLPRVSGALAQRLGGYPFWQGESACGVVLNQIYRASSEVGLSIYLGEADPEKTEER